MRKRIWVICLCMLFVLEQIVPTHVQAAKVVSVLSAADELKYAADGVTYVYNEETKNYEVSKCDADVEQVTIPESIRGILVTKIRDHAFAGCDKLEQIVMADTVTEIGEFAFDSCSSLQTMYLPKSLNKIESFAFFGCSSLQAVEIPEGTSVIGGFAFYNCSDMKYIKIPVSVESIGSNAFVHCDNLVILCTAGSTGYTYASSNGIPFSFKTSWEETTPPEPTIEPIQGETTAPISTSKPISTVEPVSTQVPSYTIYFQGVGGTLPMEEKQVTYGETYGELPVPTKEGYHFLGWYTSVDEEGIKITEDTIVNLSSIQVLYAHWEGKTFSVSFDGNGGMVEGGAINVVYDKTYGTLPTATKEGETFLGWYTKKEDGNHITSDNIYKMNDNQTLYAHWTKKNAGAKLEDLTFSFGNNHNVFSYENNYVIPLSTFQQIFGETEFSNMQYEDRDQYGNIRLWSGNCFGMCSAAVMLFAGDTDVQREDFNEEAEYISELTVTDQSRKIQMTLTKFIESLQVVQRDPITNKEKNKNGNQLELLYETIKQNQEEGLLPVIIYIYGSLENGEQGGHAVVGYETQDDKILVYDPNFPGEERSIQIRKDENGNCIGWSYSMNNFYSWGTEESQSYISFVSYDKIKEVWEKRFGEEYNHVESNVGYISTSNAKIYNETGELVATIVNGQMITENPNLYLSNDVTSAESAKGTKVKLYMPTGEYTIENTDKNENTLWVAMVNVQQSASVTTESSKVTILVNDSKRVNSIACDASRGEHYTMELRSTFFDDNKSVEISGIAGTDGNVGISQRIGQVEVQNCESENLTINGIKKQSYMIFSSSNEGGTISYMRNQAISTLAQNVLEGENATYIITPDEGYILQELIVDGVNCGNVSTYCFENVSESHKIEAVFTKLSSESIAVSPIGTYAYTGEKIKPSVQVSIGNTQLKAGIDYSLIYARNVNPGKAKVTIVGLGIYKGIRKCVAFEIILEVGEKYTVGDVIYKVTSTKSNTVAVIGIQQKSKSSITIPKNVKIGSRTYQITQIGTKAFYGCKNLKKIIIQTTNLKSVGTKAFSGIYKKAEIKVPASQKTAYKKLLEKKGQGSGVKIK